jgi:hypothetical protein
MVSPRILGEKPPINACLLKNLQLESLFVKRCLQQGSGQLG